MKHTPGPWKSTVYHNSESGNTRIEIESEKYPYQVAKVYHDEIGNARLIASAPELLEALRDALCRLGDGDIPQSEHLTDLLGKGWDAIAKATGENRD